MTIKDRRCLVVIALATFTLFSILIFQFYTIQIIDGEKWTRVASRQHFFVVEEPFKRGTFYSNTSLNRRHPEKPKQLVHDIETFHLYIDPLSIPENHRDLIAQKLMSICQPKNEAVFRSHFARKCRSRKVAMWLDRQKRDAILAWWGRYSRSHRIPRNALFFVADYKRSYPFGKLLGQVLHTIQSTKDERTKQALPTGGLEKYFHSYLIGKQGKKILKRSPSHAFETGTVVSKPENGADIVLTINHYLQAIAEDELEKGVEKSRAKGGWAVMMDPRTGEILALAQYPFFYPEYYQDYFNDPERIEHTRVKAVTDANEPGSVMKPLTLAIALLANKELSANGEPPLFDPEEKMDCSQGHFPGRRKELRDISRGGYLNMKMAMYKSSNIYCAKLVEKIIERKGHMWYRNILQNIFGFGVKTNIEFASESRGVLPMPGKVHPNGALEWSTPTPYSLAFGYNLQANSIQLLRAYALLVNGGYFVQPTVIRQVAKMSAEGEKTIVIDHTCPERVQSFPQVLVAAIAQEVVQAMKYVTKSGGSGRHADIWGFTETGKTSTVHKIEEGVYSKSKYIGSFIGFSPVSNPLFLLLVSVDEPERRYIPGFGHNHHGSCCAAPIFKEIATRSLEYLGATPDDPWGYPCWDPRYDPEKADWISEIRELQEMYKKWNN
ncbi:MAG: penicillin-binding protein 2 [Waddliaceae bacterium]